MTENETSKYSFTVATSLTTKNPLQERVSVMKKYFIGGGHGSLKSPHHHQLPAP